MFIYTYIHAHLHIKGIGKWIRIAEIGNEPNNNNRTIKAKTRTDY